MNILIKKALILDRDSAHFNKQKDLLIVAGKIVKIEDDIEYEDAQEIKGKELYVSQSWIDLKADFCDPGHEDDEDIQSGLEVAQNSGFGHVFLVPTTLPVIDNKGQVNYIKSASRGAITSLYPMGAITKETSGESISEMYDLYTAGVRLFTDNSKYVSSGILLRALLYTQDFGGSVILTPQDNTIGKHGQVNEGIASLKTGLKAIPALGEEIGLQRDLKILEYTEGAVHISGISSARSVALIREAKLKGLQVTCDVHVHQLLFNELDTLGFDTNHKVFPPYRREEDRLALWKGLEDDTIDCIVSNHQPKIIDKKDLEFDHADFGNITLQTMYASLLKERPEAQSIFIDKITRQPRKIAKIQENTSLNNGNIADITIFDASVDWTFNETANFSKSKNSPFFGKKLKGKAMGIIKDKKLYLTQ